jgi:hypothetical protein
MTTLLPAADTVPSLGARETSRRRHAGQPVHLRVISITGSRNGVPSELQWRALYQLGSGPGTHLLHGGAPGIDRAVAERARRLTCWVSFGGSRRLDGLRGLRGAAPQLHPRPRRRLSGLLWRRPGHGQLHAPGARARHARRGPLSSRLSHSRRLLRLILGGLRLPPYLKKIERVRTRTASEEGRRKLQKLSSG